MKPLVLAALSVLLLAGCATPGAEPTATDDPLTGKVTVLAAASLTDLLDEVADAFEALHPNVEVVISYGGSSLLTFFIAMGLVANVSLRKHGY